MLDAPTRRHWERHGWLWWRSFFSPAQIEALVRWTDEVAAWPEVAGKWMRYDERPRGAAGGRQLARIENFVPYHGGLASLVGGERLLGLLAECCGEPVILFKDKVNFKLAGGAGFADHQDAPAYVDFGVRQHLTAMIPVDPFTRENGCLEMARDACEPVLLPQNGDGTVRAEVMESLTLEPLLAQPGDLIVFHAWVPHRSGPNRSSGPRRAYYLTYNPRSAGDRRAEYYARKRACFPPEIERRPGVDYARLGRQFNLGNPFD